MAPALAVALLALPAHASKKDDDYKRAQQAVATGDVITAARLFCALADEDSKFKDVVSQCEVYKNETKRQRNVEQKRLDDARAAAKAGKLDEAEDLLRKIKIADLADQAKDELGRIAGLRSQQNAAASAERSFQQAVQAYNSNDFQRARDLFGGVTGPAHAGEVRSYLDKIDNYQRAMASARRMQDAKDYKGAAAMYQEAAGIKSDGPNDPRASAAQMSQLATQAAAPQPTSAANPTTTATAKPAESSPKPSADHGAVRAAPARVDTAALMRDADAAQAKGDLGAAKGKYLAILAADPQNAQARVALNQVSALSQSSGKRQSAGAEADVMLAKAIGEYYNCLLEDADVHIRDYLAADGAKRGLAYFYQGASRVTRYYLNGAQDRQLLDDARSAFVKAKQVADFRPPDAKLVSPRVIKAYGDAR
jgi:hypothetical protein